MAASRSIIESLAADEAPHYGISTGFGALASKQIPVERRAQLAAFARTKPRCGLGTEVEREVIRALILLRPLDAGYGAYRSSPAGRPDLRRRPERRHPPLVFEYGSLGCSGDLAPLAHCASAAR